MRCRQDGGTTSANASLRRDVAQSMPANEADLKHVADLISKVYIAMLTTVDEEGKLRSRPMAVQQAPFDGTLRFLTKDDSPKIDEIERDREVNVSVADVANGIFVSVSGRGKLNRDRAKIAELWKDEFKVWVPEGKDDPHLAILEVDASAVEFWDTPPNQDESGYEEEKETKENSDHGKIELGS